MRLTSDSNVNNNINLINNNIVGNRSSSSSQVSILIRFFLYFLLICFIIINVKNLHCFQLHKIIIIYLLYKSLSISFYLFLIKFNVFNIFFKILHQIINYSII